MYIFNPSRKIKIQKKVYVFKNYKLIFNERIRIISTNILHVQSWHLMFEILNIK